jgi:hypothetical protein
MSPIDENADVEENDTMVGVTEMASVGTVATWRLKTNPVLLADEEEDEEEEEEEYLDTSA